MNVLVGLMAAAVVGHADGPTRVDPSRLEGMKEAVKDLEAGKLKLKHPPTPAPAWHGLFVKLLKEELGVESEQVHEFSRTSMRVLGGYNDVMTVEIEHRHGKGAVEKLRKKAEEMPRKKE